MKTKEIIRGFKTAEARWSRFGPYYAMFPMDFVVNVIKRYSKENDYIIDPFAGRGSSIYAGSVLNRNSIGIEINPVGWLYGFVKLHPALKEDVIQRLNEIYKKRNYYSKAIENLPEFFKICYCREVLKFLLAAKNNLKWQEDRVDSTLMSFILVYLHGKLGEGLSNQMRMTKSMGMNYAIKWWNANNMANPPEIDPLKFMLNKIDWRYKKGLPIASKQSSVIYGDSTIELNKLVKKFKKNNNKISLLFTSPPYMGVTDYHADQWLRLWILGEDTRNQNQDNKNRGRFSSKTDYYNMLNSVFNSCSKIMDHNSIIYVRTDAREYTLNVTLEILRNNFPKLKIKSIVSKPFLKKTQTELFGNTTSNPSETDIIMSC